MDIHGLSSSSATNSAIIHSDNTGAIQSKLRTLLSMKVQTSGILILIACILTGCGKSMKDVAGVYETAEIKEPQSSGSYYSTTWVLDLAESGTFTLKENKLRKSIVKTREPVPMNGSEVSGAWSLDSGRIIIVVKGLVDKDGNPDIVLKIPFDVQSSGDLVSGGIIGGGNAWDDYSNDEITAYHNVFDQFDTPNPSPNLFDKLNIKGLRFKRVE